MVRIELFGVPRLKASRDVVSVDARTLGSAIEALASACPELNPSVINGGKLGGAYIVALNGQQLTRDPELVLSDGDVLVLVAAQAGG